MFLEPSRGGGGGGCVHVCVCVCVCEGKYMYTCDTAEANISKNYVLLI